jgi:GTPase involved in cell partitioning and DNA repair
MKSKRFKDKQSIIDAIDAKHAQLTSKTEAVESYENEVRQYQMIIAKNKPPLSASEIGQFQKDIFSANAKKDKLLKQIKSIEKTGLPRLKRTLAAFQTEPMAFNDGQDVVLQ